MPMTSLNISLPEPLKRYGRKAGRFGRLGNAERVCPRTDSARQGAEPNNLEQELIAAAKGPKIELPVAEIRRKGLIPALCERADSLKLDRLRRDIRDGLDSGPARPWSVAEMKREGRKRLSTRRASAK